MLRIEYKIDHGIDISILHPDLLTCNIYGDTFFSIFYEKLELLDLAYQKVLELNLETETEDVQDIYIRKLFYNICLPFILNTRRSIISKDLGRKHETHVEAKNTDSTMEHRCMSILF